MRWATFCCNTKLLLFFLLNLSLFIIISGCGQSQRQSIAFNNDNHIKITGSYSNMHYVEEEGDLLGLEFFIINSRNGSYILFQESEGSPTVLFLAPIDVDKNHISFTFPADAPRHDNFVGTVTTNSLIGKFKNSYGHYITLEKKESYWVDNTPSRQITGHYSNMYYNEEGGDLLGYEFFIVLGEDGYYVLYQESSGEPDVPILLPVKVDGMSISFTVPPAEQFPGQFTGSIISDELTGKFNHSDEQIVLKRKSSYWQ